MLSSFAWVQKPLLAGSGRPGLLSEIEDDVAFIASAGFRLIVTLTEQGPNHDWAREGIETLHFPIPDMGIPTPRALAPACARISRAIAAREPVLVHCRAGLGRTGLVLACCLVDQGLSAASAVRQIRDINHRYIQNTLQERFVTHYARFINRQERRA